MRRRATATRRAREIRLQAQRRQVEELQRRSREAVLRLQGAAGYPELLDRLARAVREISSARMPSWSSIRPGSEG